MWRLAPWLIVWLAGCSIDRSGLGTRGSSDGRDGGGVDAAGVDAGGDAGSADAGRDAPLEAGPCSLVDCPAESCAEILERFPDSGDGTYELHVGGREVEVFCDMTTRGGGWTGVVDFDGERDPCPGEWVSAGDEDGCELDGPSCLGESASAFFDVAVESYREVLGTARGVQYFSTDGFHTDESIDDEYVDGVSITTESPRRHVFTLASGLLLDGTGGNMCPCRSGGSEPPAFVGDDWLCDSGNDTGSWESVFYPYPLWDEDADTPECSALGEPTWFHSELDEPASGPLEVRILLDQCDENVLITSLRLLVR